MINQVQIETSSLCTAKCVFCPHKNLKRSKGLMSDDVFNKIIIDCKSVGVHTICPFLNGEMFTDPKIFERLEIINKELPNTNLVIFSNMSLLTEEKLERLSKIKNIQYFGMSLTSYDIESCKKYMDLNFNVVWENVKNLVLLNNKNRFIKRLEVSCIDQKEKENIKFKSCWNRLKGIDRIFISAKQNWMGKISSNLNINNNKICPRTSHICILHTGKVALCCFDAEGEYSIGDVKEQTIEEIYNSDKYKKYRNNLKKDLVPCNNCTV